MLRSRARSRSVDDEQLRYSIARCASQAQCFEHRRWWELNAHALQPGAMAHGNPSVPWVMLSYRIHAGVAGRRRLAQTDVLATTLFARERMFNHPTVRWLASVSCYDLLASAGTFGWPPWVPRSPWVSLIKFAEKNDDAL